MIAEAQRGYLALDLFGISSRGCEANRLLYFSSLARSKKTGCPGTEASLLDMSTIMRTLRNLRKIGIKVIVVHPARVLVLTYNQTLGIRPPDAGIYNKTL